MSKPTFFHVVSLLALGGCGADPPQVVNGPPDSGAPITDAPPQRDAGAPITDDALGVDSGVPIADVTLGSDSGVLITDVTLGSDSGAPITDATPMRDSPSTAGRVLGESCVLSGRNGSSPTNRCLTDICIPESNPDSMGHPTYTGWNGGYCSANCSLPAGFNTMRYFDGSLLPQSNCSMGAICLPGRGAVGTDGVFPAGQPGDCFVECRTDTDCRRSEAYYCKRAFRTATSTVTFTNGVCVPVDCANTAMLCPTGYRCVRSMSGTTGTCVPAAS